MKPFLHAVVVAIAFILNGCVVYEPVAVGPSVQQRFDRSYAAAAAAMSDEGLAITAQDRGSGTIRGTRDGTTIVASVQTLADGRIQVKFYSSGSGVPNLVHRVSDSYDRRMGR